MSERKLDEKDFSSWSFPRNLVAGSLRIWQQLAPVEYFIPSHPVTTKINVFAPKSSALVHPIVYLRRSVNDYNGTNKILLSGA